MIQLADQRLGRAVTDSTPTELVHASQLLVPKSAPHATPVFLCVYDREVQQFVREVYSFTDSSQILRLGSPLGRSSLSSLIRTSWPLSAQIPSIFLIKASSILLPRPHG